jgi:hypothetical protein
MPPKSRKRITKKYAFEKDVQIKIRKLDVDKKNDEIIHIESSSSSSCTSSSSDEEEVFINHKSSLNLVENNIDGEIESKNVQEPITYNHLSTQIDFHETDHNYFFKNNFNYEINSIKMNLQELADRNKCVIS